MLCRVFLKETKKIFELIILEFFTSCNQQSLCSKVFICAAHVFPSPFQLWDTPQSLWHQDNLRTCYGRFLSVQILKMHYGKRRTSPRSRCLMAEKMLKKLHIAKTLRWWHFGIKKSRELVARKCYENLLLLSIPVHWSQLGQDCLFLPIERIRVTTQARLPISWEGYKLWFNLCRQVQIPIDTPKLSDSIDRDSVFTSKF